MASHLPAPSKRHFIPTFDSFFNENKKRKLNSLQCEDLLPNSVFPLDSESRERLILQAQGNEQDRQKLVEAATYGFHPQILRKPGKPEFDPSQLSSEERELTDILKRPKFKAKPVPKSTYSAVVGKQKSELETKTKVLDARRTGVTIPQGGQLHQEVRGYEKQSKQLEEMHKLSNSRSQSDSDSQFLSSRLPHPTIPEPFRLHTSQRSEERQVFDSRVRQKEEIRTQLQEQEQADRRKKEQQEIKKMRLGTVFKAQPIFRPNAFVPVKSCKPLTRPESPHLSSSQRSMQEFPNGTLDLSQQSFLSQDLSFFKD